MSQGKEQFINLEYGKGLKYWDHGRVILDAFTPSGAQTEVRFFRKKPDNYIELLTNVRASEQVNEKGITEFRKADSTDHELFSGYEAQQKIKSHFQKIISRSAFASLREPFIIEPWNQCLIDYANRYGSKVDDDKEHYLLGDRNGDEILYETKISLAKILQTTNLVWAGRSQMICHPEGLIYGEIDEIWYDKQEDKYYIGDTKTSSSVDKIGYWYQLGMYIEILKELNPELANKISSKAIIHWIRIKNEKWSLRSDFNDKDDNGEYINPAKKYEYSKWILDNSIGKKPETIEKAKQVIESMKSTLNKYEGRNNEAKENDSIYWLKWSKEMIQLEEPEWNNELIHRDLEAEGVLQLVRDDINFIRKYNITPDNIETFLDNPEAKMENDLLQKRYDELKSKFN